MNIGFYSGSFDPIHTGHTTFATDAINEAKLDTLYVIAEPVPWRKNNLTDISHRQNMVELAFADNSKVETKFDGLKDSHDVETTLKLINSKHKDDNIYLLMGADVFLSIDSWKDYEKLVDRVKFIVALRTEDDGEEMIYKMQELSKAKVTKIVTDKATVSSSKTKSDLSDKYLDKKVYQYIKENNLY